MVQSNSAAGLKTDRYERICDKPRGRRTKTTIKKRFADPNASGKRIPIRSRKVVKAMESAKPKGMGQNPKAPHAKHWCYDHSDVLLLKDGTGVKVNSKSYAWHANGFDYGCSPRVSY